MFKVVEVDKIPELMAGDGLLSRGRLSGVFPEVMGGGGCTRNGHAMMADV